MAKLINIVQPIPTGHFAIVPIGLLLNDKLQKSRPDVVEFWQGWRHEKRRVAQMAKMRINTPEFAFLMRHVYGRGFCIADLMKKFEDWSCDAGAGYEGFDREQCLVLEVEKIKEEE